MKFSFAAALVILLLPIQTLRAGPLEDINSLADTGNYAGALQRAETWLRQAPGDIQARFTHARLLAAVGRTTQAIQAYQGLAKADPYSPEAYNNLAVLFAQQGDLEAAKQALEHALATNPSYSTVYENLSAIYVEMARDSYVKALQLGVPSHQVVLRALSELPAPAMVAESGADGLPRVPASSEPLPPASPDVRADGATVNGARLLADSMATVYQSVSMGVSSASRASM